MLHFTVDLFIPSDSLPTMDWVPLLFFDDVCHQLRKPTFWQVSQLSGNWSKFGSEHGEKRIELKFRCRVSYQEVSYGFWETGCSREVTVEDLNLEFDRITSFACGSAFPNDTCVNRVSLREFERVVQPTVAPLVANCWWWYLDAQRSDQNRFFFNAFKNCPGFNEIHVQEHGQESREFIARQVQLGNIRKLNLYGTDRWPKAENLAEMLKIFVSSTRFHKLVSPDPLPNDYKLFELFLERALANELKPGAYINTFAGNLETSRLLSLHPECHDDLEKDTWRIPDSNLRIALRHYSGMLCVSVK